VQTNVNAVVRLRIRSPNPTLQVDAVTSNVSKPLTPRPPMSPRTTPANISDACDEMPVSPRRSARHHSTGSALRSRSLASPASNSTAVANKQKPEVVVVERRSRFDRLVTPQNTENVGPIGGRSKSVARTSSSREGGSEATRAEMLRRFIPVNDPPVGRPTQRSKSVVERSTRRAATAAPKAWVPAVGSDPQVVLAKIREAQDGRTSFPSYEKALKQIRAGKKTGHWVWYVWPCLSLLRPGTSQPRFLLSDIAAAQAYLADEVLTARLREITEAAVERLRAGVAAKVLFGSSGDSEKFAETMTFFAVAAVENDDAAILHLFAEGLSALGARKLDPRTMGLIVDRYGLEHYRDIKTVRQLTAVLTGAPFQSEKSDKLEGDFLRSKTS